MKNEELLRSIKQNHYELSDKYTKLLEDQPTKDRCVTALSKTLARLDRYKAILGALKRQSKDMEPLTVLKNLVQKTSLAVLGKAGSVSTGRMSELRIIESQSLNELKRGYS